MPLENFIACITYSGENEDNGTPLNQLIIYGNPPVEELAEAWAGIYAEYIDLNNDNEAKYLLDLQRDIAISRGEIAVIEAILTCLSIAYVPALHKELENYDVHVDLTPGDREAYIKQLNAANESLAQRRLEHQMKEDEYRDYMAERANDSIDRNYFIRMLRRLARFNRVVTIRPKDITVEEFVFMIADMIESSKQHVKEEN